VLDAAYQVAIQTIKTHKDLHIKISQDLLQKEEISREEFENYFIDMKFA
jgi:ATP-dependent Zn protease